MAKVSIIIPSRAEKPENLLRTIQSIYDNATGEFEVLVGFDGQPFIQLPERDNLHVYKFDEPIGIKAMINELASLASGKYIMKLDAHCSVGKGFDEILQADMQDNWVVTPRFYVLDGKTWEWQDERFYDYFYLSCPFTDPKGLRFKAGGHWPEMTKEKLDILPIDETPQMHGSCWFVNRDFFLNVIGGFDVEHDPMGHAQEPPYLGLKMWLGLGKLMVNKNTWYAHLHQDSKERGYPEDRAHTERTYNMVADYWIKQPGFDKFVEKFMPMPTWLEDWRVKYEQYIKDNS